MTERKSIIQSKSYAFSLRIIKLYQYLIKEKQEFVLAKQILRCGTSIGANVEESIGGQSEKDFLAKLFIAYKEARETKYWINLLVDSNILEAEIASSLQEDCEELLKIIGKTISTMKSKLKNN